MVLKLYGLAGHRSPSALVAMVLNEKKVPFELVPVDITTGELKTPEHRARNPFGQVPYIDDDGFILYESHAICRYISMKYREQGTPLLPPADDIKATALFEQAISVEAAAFNPPLAGLMDEVIYKPRRGLTLDQAKYDEHMATLSAKLDVYDEILGKQKYLAGNELTLADLFHVPGGSILGRIGSDLMTQKPNVARWFNDISSRESCAQVLKDGVKSTA